MLKTRLLCPLAGVVTLLAPGLPVRADDVPASAPDHFVIDDDNPESNLPTPAEATARLMDFGTMMAELSSRADGARKREDWQAAVKYHRALAVLMPNVASSFALVCQDYEQLGDRQAALEACGTALNKEDAKLDVYARFVSLVSNRPDGLDKVELDDATAAIDHLKAAEATRVAGYQLQCELSLRTKDAAALKECADKLMELAPNDASSITFAWTAALRQGNYDRARELVEVARAKKLPPEAIERMERGTASFANSKGAPQLTAWQSMNPMLRWLLGLSVLLVAGIALARKKFTGRASV